MAPAISMIQVIPDEATATMEPRWAPCCAIPKFLAHKAESIIRYWFASFSFGVFFYTAIDSRTDNCITLMEHTLNCKFHEVTNSIFSVNHCIPRCKHRTWYIIVLEQINICSKGKKKNKSMKKWRKKPTPLHFVPSLCPIILESCGMHILRHLAYRHCN